MAKIVVETPRGKIIQTKSENGTIVAELKWKPGFGGEYSAKYNKAQTFVDSEVLRLCDPLTPMRSKALILAGTLATEVGSGLVQYNAPYAKYHYYGKLMIGPAPKKLTDIDLTYEGAPQRGAFWFERMKANDAKVILKGAGKIVGK
ncbi:minor capsid protein [Allocoprobacillus halotolerans]|uniref:Minor capsid protein n=1 Tax=Allocoprobacillus halotolerans TaxID=2944914 RepID=A0ABY5I1Z0_9FIRM|nr:minor capsid protein [Allocoprobacillus halotolerans]UTY39387.1 minor capsid protein [Allocoprobacillus halotolerans]